MTSLTNKIKLSLIGIGVLGAIGLVGAVINLPHFDRDTYVATVTDKERIVRKSGDDISSKYLVFTKLQNGEVRVFENTDSLIEWKFNSSSYQGKLEIGKTYKIKTYGWRIPFFSKYENVVGIEEITELNEK